MADLRTTAEERASLRGFNTDFYAGAGGDISVALSTRLLDDLDTLLAENAKLRAVAEAARQVADTADEENVCALRRALAALEAP